MPVEIFKTNIDNEINAALVKAKINALYPEIRINFDLQDCDRILRIAGNDIIICELIRIVNSTGFYCEILL